MVEIELQKKYIEKVKQINIQYELKYYILTMGCQLNESDSEKFMGMLEMMGYVKTDNVLEANLYILNTCCVRENAEEKLFGKLRRIKSTKRSK